MRELTCGEARDMASELIDRDLSPDDEASLQAHIATCSTCPNLYRAMVAVQKALSKARTSEHES
jgi:predicted anti-sigma-YlaC factor YlaD